jgi:hypothetical protein
MIEGLVDHRPLGAGAAPAGASSAASATAAAVAQTAPPAATRPGIVAALVARANFVAARPRAGVAGGFTGARAAGGA